MARKPDPDAKIGWVSFDDRAAILKRVIVPGGTRGFLLRTGSGEAAETVRKNAIDFGFTELKTRGILRMLFADGNVPFSARHLADNLGGKVIAISRSDLMSDKWTINLSDRAPALGAAAQPERIVPDMNSVETIGLNSRGEEVIRDNQGRFFRKINNEDGSAEFIHEGEGERHTLFLRAAKAEDLESIASSMVMMGSKGTLHAESFARVIDAALEAGPHGHLEMDRAEAEDVIRRHMVREISAIAIDNDASRDRFVRALRLSDSMRFVLSRRSDEATGFSPSPAFASFIRRNVRGQSAVDFRGSEDMKVAMPRVFREGAALQFHDLTGIGEDGRGAYASNVLARREAEGQSILIMPGNMDEDAVERIRHDLGRAYSLEAVARVPASVADGFHDGAPIIAFFVGERRPEILEALPQAALRDFPVVTSDDLINLEREIFRSRARIRDFHRGVEDDIAERDDNREENIRQKPYQPLSQTTEPFTMIPVALEGATAKALARVQRDVSERGGVDAVVGGALGQSLDTLGDILTSEQIDAVAMQMNAAQRGRGFLLADQTGVGKGRSLAAMARAFLRGGENRKVLYFTESATINAPDVCRDLKDVGAWDEINVTFLTTGTQMTDTIVDPVSGAEITRTLSSPTPARRKAILESERWPEDSNVIITTYSQFRAKEDTPSSIWLDTALDENTMIIFDEAHNALNERSLQGVNARRAINAVGVKENIIFGTATPTRDPSGLNLYEPLLPRTEEAGMSRILNDLRSGGEISQEVFASMMAEDGVMLRRDHDLSNIEFRVELPDDSTMIRYQEIMNNFSPAVELMIDANLRIGEHMGRQQAAMFNQMRARGVSEETARARTNAMNQYSIAIGSPLVQVSRMAMNAIKTSAILSDRVGQVVETALREIEEGRKPLITFHSTNAALLQELSRDADGKISEEAMAEIESLSLKDQILRVHDNMYKVRIEGEVQDARHLYPDVAEISEMIIEHIDALPESLAASPVDRLIEQMENHGISVGEISGRTLRYRDGKIERRSTEDRNRRQVIDRFNNGDLDALIYNSAGATGGSYHASANFRDQRPRTMIELEAPLDVIKYVQSLGRGNRYGQVARPRVVSVMTGLTPEMRILQQRNRKLRSLGASVDGNRSHPLLLDDVPDLLNKVGDEATRNVLKSMPALARRLGFPEYAEDNDERGENFDIDSGSGAGIGSGAESLANKVLARSLMLSAAGQDDLVQRIKMEFDALIEELESRNANPLRPKELDGQIDIKTTTLFSGEDQDDDSLDKSAFMAPLYISTGVHNFNEEAWTGDRLVTEVESARRIYGADGFSNYAERINQNLPALMRPFLHQGVELEEAMENPRLGGGIFERRFNRLSDLAWLLENIKPGVEIRYPSADDKHGSISRIIVGMVPPVGSAHYEVASAYKIKTIMPGMSKPETTALSRIMSNDLEKIIFRTGLSETFSESYLNKFNQESVMTRRFPVQILSGNILRAISESAQHGLGSVSLYRDMENHVHRGIVVPTSDVDLSKLPVSIPSARVMAEAAYRMITDDELRNSIGAGASNFRIWGSMKPDGDPGDSDEADIFVSVTPRTFTIFPPPLRKSTEDFYRERPGLYELIHDREMPASSEVPKRAMRRGNSNLHRGRFSLETDSGIDRARAILGLLDGTNLITDGRNRTVINTVVGDFNRMLGEDIGNETGAAPEIAPEDTPMNEVNEARAHDAPPEQADLPAEHTAEPAVNREASFDDGDFEQIEWN